MMASHTPDHGRASALPLSAVLASIPSYPRPIIERLVSQLIDSLDEQDGDADAEDATDVEDEGIRPYLLDFYRNDPSAIGCPVDGDWDHQAGSRGLCYVQARDCEDAEDGADAEREAWSHPDDHPSELHIGRRTPARQLRDE